MTIQKFEEILAWQKGRDLTVQIYNLLSNSRDFGFKDQITRASISICNNIAEGFERRSNKEIKQFFFISKGSAGEVRSMLYIGLDLKYFTQAEFDKLFNLTIDIGRLLSGFIKTL
jgi:four helix bundle protein